MSDLPSTSKSPEPLTCQAGPGLLPTKVLLVMVVPFISQISAWPESFCHRTSALPSPSKSPEPLICQVGPGLPPTSGPLNKVGPFNSQIAAWPLSFCHRMSDLPSQSKSLVTFRGTGGVSPALAICQLVPGFGPTAAFVRILVPFICQTTA